MSSFLRLLPVMLLSINEGYSQTNDNRGEVQSVRVVLTGILTVRDWRCEERRAKGELPDEYQVFCPVGGTDWGLITSRDHYQLYGDTALFKQYERGRVTITGLATGRKIAVDSIVPAWVADGELLRLIEELRSSRWIGPENNSSPIHWAFNFTDSMLSILQAGLPAQDILMQHLGDREIMDQILILLGGVGDERVVESIIQAMPTAAEAYQSREAKRINRIANIALTNITVSEVIWHHGGGIPYERCTDDPKSCWQTWWAQNKDSFRVSLETLNRGYSNYPNYGVYLQQ
jgi:hypothetical protein